ncbi:MAG: hypothetical protein ACRDNW_21745 [Trebonia sp.]
MDRRQRPVRIGMLTWPGNPPVQAARQLDRDRGDPCNVIDLTGVTQGSYELCCVPLRLVGGCDGTPVRALLRPLDSGGKDA